MSTYHNMIREAIWKLDDPKGSPINAIKNYILANNTIKNFYPYALQASLNKGVETKQFIKQEKLYKLSKEEKEICKQPKKEEPKVKNDRLTKSAFLKNSKNLNHKRGGKNNRYDYNDGDDYNDGHFFDAVKSPKKVVPKKSFYLKDYYQDKGYSKETNDSPKPEKRKRDLNLQDNTYNATKKPKTVSNNTKSDTNVASLIREKLTAKLLEREKKAQNFKKHTPPEVSSTKDATNKKVENKQPKKTLNVPVKLTTNKNATSKDVEKKHATVKRGVNKHPMVKDSGGKNPFNGGKNTKKKH